VFDRAKMRRKRQLAQQHPLTPGGHAGNWAARIAATIVVRGSYWLGYGVEYIRGRMIRAGRRSGGKQAPRGGAT
jgi:hypothetical protein